MHKQNLIAIERVHQLLWIPRTLPDGAFGRGHGHERRVHVELDESNLVLGCETR